MRENYGLWSVFRTCLWMTSLKFRIAYAAEHSSRLGPPNEYIVFLLNYENEWLIALWMYIVMASCEIQGNTRHEKRANGGNAT